MAKYLVTDRGTGQQYTKTAANATEAMIGCLAATAAVINEDGSIQRANTMSDEEAEWNEAFNTRYGF